MSPLIGIRIQSGIASSVLSMLPQFTRIEGTDKNIHSVMSCVNLERVKKRTKLFFWISQVKCSLCVDKEKDGKCFNDIASLSSTPLFLPLYLWVGCSKTNQWDYYCTN